MSEARRLWTFSGGIHPEEHKGISVGHPIKKAKLPKQLILPLKQHIGNHAEPLVAVGDLVLKGQKIADSDSFLSAPVHASCSGSVVAIEPRMVPHASGMTDTCIVIETDGKEQWCDLDITQDIEALSANDIRHKIREAGIAGMGGAGFPTHIKLNPSAQYQIDTLIINAVECEPYITSDDMLMRERAEQIVAGIELVAKLLDVKNVLIGIEDNKPEAIVAMQTALVGTPIELVVIPTKYPSGGEKQLCYILTGREVPAGKIPADIGIVMQNVGTCYAVQQAIYEGKPLISRITTLTGNNINKPGNYEVLLGTPISDLLDAVGIKREGSKIVMGGPMMGVEMHSNQVPVVKTTNCLLLPLEGELPSIEAAKSCIRCGQCADACPAYLLPQQLYWFSQSQNFEKAQQYNLMDCIECGCCAYVCPSEIPLVQYYRYAKNEIRLQTFEQQEADRAKQRYEARIARLEREKQEKEEQRRQRNELAKKKAAEAKQVPDGQGTDDKSALIQAALARVEAKKKAKQASADVAEQTDNLDKEA